MMNLHEYLTREGITQRAFAQVLGVDQGTVSRLSKKLLTPSLQLALKIQRATNGQVPVEFWDEQDENNVA